MMEKFLSTLHLRSYDPIARKARLERVEAIHQLADEIRSNHRRIRVIEENDDSVDFMRGRPRGR